jgi:hypothetical protein
MHIKIVIGVVGVTELMDINFITYLKYYGRNISLMSSR